MARLPQGRKSPRCAGLGFRVLTPSLAGVQFRSSPAVPTSADAWVCPTALQHSTGWFTGTLDKFCTEITFTSHPLA